MNMDKIRVLIFVSEISTDGITKILSDYVRNFSNNIQVELMTYRIDNDIYFKDIDIKIYEIGISKNFFKRISKEKKIMKNNNYDVIHINGNYCSRIFDCIASKMSGIKKVIIHSHNTGTGNNSKFRRIVHTLTKKMFDFFATDYFACSDEAAKWMFSGKIYKNRKYHFIKNGIDVNKYIYNEQVRSELRTKYDLSDKFVVGHIGRFQYQKNHSFLIDMFYEIQKKKENSMLLLIGTGELENSIKEKVKNMKIDEKVIFLGNKSDAYKFYNAMDCFAFPSFFEGLPIVAIEAQTSGLPIFVCKNAVTDAANVSKNFIKIDSFDAKLWASIVLEHKPINRREAYIDTQKAGYNIKSVVKEIETFYSMER